jgi:DNA repair protein RecO (recombination protein O)
LPAAVADEGVVLRRRNYQEADRILVILTRDHGKVSCLARGVRRPRARNAAGLDLLGRAQLLLIPGRSLYVLAQARPVGAAGRGDDPVRLACVALFAEAADGLLEEGHPEPAIFALVGEHAERLLDVRWPPRPELVLALFRLAAEVGYLPALDRCMGCDRPLENRPGTFVPELGGVVQPPCPVPGGVRCEAATIRVLRALARGDYELGRRLRWGSRLLPETEAVLVAHLRHRLDRRLLAADVLAQLVEAGAGG